MFLIPIYPVKETTLSSIPRHDLEPGPVRQCQVCGNEALEPVIDLGHQPPCDSLLTPAQFDEAESNYPLRFLRCPECGLAQIDYAVSSEVLFYPEYPYRSGITTILANNLRSTGFRAVDKYRLKTGELVVDIGSNDGTLLSSFKEKGMRVLGVEPTNIAKIANEQGITTLQCFFDEKTARDIVTDHGHASVVTAANMFAHVQRLGGLIRGVEYLLKDRGVFITESHYLLDLLDTVQYDSIYHEHLKYYSVRSLIRLFSYYNFTVTDVERIENYGGSIRVYAEKGKNLSVSDNVSHLLQEEEKYGLYTLGPFKLFADRVRKSKFELQQLLVNAKAAGKTVVGVGCPGRASTLVNYCGIDVDIMPIIAEQSSSLKLGLRLPGKHIPIMDEKVMFENQPDYALILSWHYWRPIVEKLRKKGLKSKIIIPLPNVQVLD